MRLRDFSKDINKKFLTKDKLLDLYQHARLYSEHLLHFYNLAAEYRISKLGKNQIEFVIPPSFRNLDEFKCISDHVFLSLGTQAFKMLWKKKAFDKGWQVQVQKINWQKIKPAMGEIRLRWSLPDLQVEVAQAEINKNKISEQNAVLYFYDDKEQICGELSIEAQILQVEMIACR